MVLTDPSKQAPEAPKTMEELLEELGTFNPEDAITFAEEPHTMIGMLIQHGHEVECLDMNGSRVIVIPSIDVDVVYDEHAHLQEITVHDANRKKQYEKDTNFTFDDFEITEEEAQAHYDKLNADTHSE